MLKRVLSVISFDSSVVSSVAADEGALRDAYLLVLAVSVVSSALVFAFPVRFGLDSAVAGGSLAVRVLSFVVASGLVFAVSVLALWVSSWLYRLAASLLGGSGSAGGLFRAFGFAAPLGLLSYLPVVGWLVSLWVFALDVFIISVVEELSVARAVGAFALVVFSVLLLVLLVFGAVLFAGGPAVSRL